MERLRENLSVPSPLLAEKIVQEIIRDTGVNIREVGIDEAFYTKHGYCLEFGRKRLILNIEDAVFQFDTYIKNVRDEEERIQGEVSKLYQAAKELMEAYVAMKQHDYRYIFQAHYKDENSNKNVMRDWALTRGQEIFDWEEILGSDREGVRVCTRTFYHKE